VLNAFNSLNELNSLKTSGASWSPVSLFGARDTGFVFDLTKMSSLFQDSLGTTPVTKFGDPVGLVIDQLRAMPLGPELISGSWTLTVTGTATATESPAGTLNLTGDGTNQAIADISIATVIGATYKITASVSSSGVNTVVGTTQGGSSVVGTTPLALGPNTVTFVATSSTSWIRFFKTPAALAVVTTISARQVTHLGSERITNGSFSTDLSGWTTAHTAPSTVNWVGGVATWSTDGVNPASLRQSFPTVVGETYLVNLSGSTVNVGIGTASGATDVVGNATNSVRPVFSFVATATTSWLNTTSTINGATLDNVSVRQIIKDGSEMNSIMPWTLTVTGTATATETTTGTLNLTGDGSQQAKADKSFTTVPGATYRVTFNVSSSAALATVGTTQGDFSVVTSTSFNVGTGSFVFLATTTTSWLRFYKLAAALSIVSGISLKLVAGTHASQSTSTKRPIYSQQPSFKTRNLVQYSSDLSNAAWIKNGTTTVTAAGENTPLGNPAWLITYADTTNSPVACSYISAKAGQIYTLSAWIKAGTAPNMILRTNPAGSSLLVTPTAGWVRYVTTGVVLADTSSFRAELRGSTTAAGTVIVGDVQLELSGAASAYQTQLASGIWSENPIRNQLTYTEDLTNAAWVETNASIATGVSDPAGGAAAFTLTATGVSGQVAQSISGSRGTAAVYVGAIYLRRRTGSGAVSLINPNNGGSTSVTVTGAWAQYQVSGAGAAATNAFGVVLAVSGDAVDIYQPQFELGNTATAYQRVVTKYEVTEAGLQSVAGLLFDGVDDFLVTPTITPGTDKGQIFAGLRKLSDAARAIFATQQGTASRLSLEAPGPALNNYTTISGGSTLTGANSGAIPAPIASVVTALDNISGVSLTLRVNGAQVASSAATQGTGNYTAGAVTLGADGSGTNPFNGVLNVLIMRFGPALTTTQIQNTESWVDTCSKAY